MVQFREKTHGFRENLTLAILPGQEKSQASRQ